MYKEDNEGDWYLTSLEGKVRAATLLLHTLTRRAYPEPFGQYQARLEEDRRHGKGIQRPSSAMTRARKGRVMVGEGNGLRLMVSRIINARLAPFSLYRILLEALSLAG